MDLRPGSILAGTYRYERDLGQGGSGRVVAATHLGLRKLVALKMMTSTTSPSAAQRFVREARLAFRLESVHVAKVYDAGVLEDGVPYIAMELLDGVDLAKLSRDRGPLPVIEACSYVVQACAGIAEAHALGIVHRDVKPANLFLARTQHGALVKVVDFGCAKAERTGATSIAYATSAEALLGTPRTMAPEQIASSRDVDARADVWSLGVTLYTLLAARPPFDGATLSALFEQIVKAPVPPIPRPLPVGLVAILERCMRKRPEERFANAGELAIALAPYARPEKKKRAPQYLAIAAVALASTVAGAAVFVLARSRTPRPPAQVPIVARAPADTSVAKNTVDSESASTAAEPSASTSTRASPKPSSLAAAAPAVSFFLDVDPTNPHTSKDATPESQRVSAKIRADRWCINARVSHCFEFPSELDCEAEITTVAYACRTAPSPDACTNASAGKHFARYRTPCAQ